MKTYIFTINWDLIFCISAIVFAFIFNIFEDSKFWRIWASVVMMFFAAVFVMLMKG